MSRIVRGALIQAKLCIPGDSPVAKIKEAMTEKTVSMLDQAAEQGAQVVSFSMARTSAANRTQNGTR